MRGLTGTSVGTGAYTPTKRPLQGGCGSAGQSEPRATNHAANQKERLPFAAGVPLPPFHSALPLGSRTPPTLPNDLVPAASFVSKFVQGSQYNERKGLREGEGRGGSRRHRRQSACCNR